jgi:hypothetical protein
MWLTPNGALQPSDQICQSRKSRSNGWLDAGLNQLGHPRTVTASDGAFDPQHSVNPARDEFDDRLMSAMGQKQTSRPEISMSALPPKADIAGRQLNVRFVPEADIDLHSRSGRPGQTPIP